MTSTLVAGPGFLSNKHKLTLSNMSNNVEALDNPLGHESYQLRAHVIYPEQYLEDDPFVFVQGNRSVNEKLVRQIQASLRIKDRTRLKPAEVYYNEETGKLEVYDGQHRIEALRREERPIHYRLVDETTLYDIARENDASKKWTMNQHLHLRVLDVDAKGVNPNVEHYRWLKNLREEYNVDGKMLSVRDLSMCFSGVHINAFKRGEFKVGKQKRNRVRSEVLKWQDLTRAAKDAGLAFWNKRGYALGCKAVMREEQYDHSHLVDVVRNDGSQYQKRNFAFLPQETSMTKYTEFLTALHDKDLPKGHRIDPEADYEI